MLVLKGCPWTPQYWRIRHQAVDMQRQCGNDALFRTGAPYEKSVPSHEWIMHEQRLFLFCTVVCFELELVKETMISAASATTIRRFELAAEAADDERSAVKEEVDYEGDDEGTPGVGELAVKPPPKKVAKTEAKMPMCLF